MVVISLSVIVTCTALTIDLGRVSTLRRDLQNVADAAALDLVRLVDGRTAGEITADPLWESTRAASLARNGFTTDVDADVAVRLGAYDAGGDVFTPVVDADQVPSAVQVVVTDRVEHHFAPGGTSTSRTAVGAQTSSAGLQIGSFAARLDSAQSRLLGPLLQDALGVEVVGYEGLAGLRVGLDELATGLGLSVGSPTRLLATEVALVDLLTAQADLLEAGGRLAEASVLRDLAVGLPAPSTPVSLGDVLAVSAGGADAAAVATLDVLELLTATAFAVQPDDAFLRIPGLDLGVPGLLLGEVEAQVVEAPQVVFGGPGATVATAQVALRTTVALDAVGLVGTELALELTAGRATATIRDLSCGTPQRLATDVTTGLLHTEAALSGTIDVGPPFGAVAEVTGSATTGHAATSGPVDFELPPDVLGAPRPWSAPGLDISSLALDTEWAFMTGLPIAGPVLSLTVAPLVEAITDATLGPLVDQALLALDAVVVRPLLALLGITLPGVDVTPVALRCSGASLVA
jgi:uncharacterized membrane protein